MQRLELLINNLQWIQDGLSAVWSKYSSTLSGACHTWQLNDDAMFTLSHCMFYCSVF